MKSAISKTVDTLIVGANSVGLELATRLYLAGLSNYLVVEKGVSCHPTHGNNIVDQQAVIDIEGLPGERLWQVTTDVGAQYLARTLVFTSAAMVKDFFGDELNSQNYCGETLDLFAWPEHWDLTGKKVALMGGGIDAAVVLPALVAQASSVKVFQRKPNWVLPKLERGTSDVRAMLELMPAVRRNLKKASDISGLLFTNYQNFTRTFALAHIKKQIADPWMRRQVLPEASDGFLPIVYTNQYYPALQAENCKLYAWPVVSFSEHGIRTAEGVEHKVDCVVDGFAFEQLKQRNMGHITSLFLATSVNPNLPGCSAPEKALEQRLVYIVAGIAHALEALHKPAQYSVFQPSVVN